MEQNNNDKNQLLKTGVKAVMQHALIPVKTAIWSGILTILPYLLAGILIFIVIFCVYMGGLEQIDEIYSTAGDLGERMANAVSLHGFKTNEDLEKDEEGKFFKMLELYTSVFSFDNYDVSLLSQTLLYEGSNEERIYLTESNSSNLDDVSLENPGSAVWGFVKNIFTNYQRGFLTSYAGQSQYLKANKNMLSNAVALKKCKLLTITNDERLQCYKGYLTAEYNIYADGQIDLGLLETDVEPGYLILDNNIFVAGYAILNDGFTINDVYYENMSSFINNLSLFSNNVIIRSFNLFIENMKYSIMIALFGDIADVTDLHFYYDGYIVKNLKEEYKVTRNDGYDDDSNTIDEMQAFFDKDIILEERKNRRKTSNDILELVETYFDLTYGYNDETKRASFMPVKGSGSYATGISTEPIPDEDLKEFSSPTTSACSLTSCFGIYGGNWGCDPHKGVDVDASGGIYSICDGTVTLTGMYNDKSASAIEVKCNINGKTYNVRYLHMPLTDVNKWNPGDYVPAGTYLGQQGAVGEGVSGAHLHLDISVGGHYVNPEALVSTCGTSLNCESARNYCGPSSYYN